MDEDLSSKAMPFTFHAVKVRHGENSDQQTIRFLDLPAEIRNQIYEDVLAEQQGSSRLPAQQPAISLTCKQVNREFLTLLWEKCKWLIA